MSSQFANLAKDSANTQENLNPQNDTFPILVRTNETILVEEGPSIFQRADLSSVEDGFVLDSGTFGVAGENTLGDVSEETTTSIYQITNPRRTFLERFSFTQLITGNGTQDSTAKTYSLTEGQSVVVRCFYDGTSTNLITSATINITYTNSLLIEVSADGGSNWTTTNNGSTVNFTNTGYDLRLRLTENSTQATFPLTFPIEFGEDATAVISFIKVEY